MQVGASATQRDGDRPHQRHRATRSRSRRPTPSARAPPSAASNAVDARRRRSSTSPTPATRPTPATPSAVELGVKFQADVNGIDHRHPLLQGRRQHRHRTSAACGRPRGTRLAQATFTNETASGWQTVTFATPVTVTAGTTYVASYFAPNGHYSATSSGLASASTTPPLHALAELHEPERRLRLRRGAARSRRSTYHATNYWVDVMYARPGAGPGRPASPRRRPASTSADVSWTAPAERRPGRRSYKITPYVGATAQTPTTVTGTPPATTESVDRADGRARPTRSRSQARQRQRRRARRRRTPTR